MKKLLFALVLSLLFVLAIATVVSADNGPHGGYTATTDACAGCHRVHSAQSGTNDLLRVPQTNLCESCHSNGLGASTDVSHGVYTTAGGSGAEGTNGAPLLGGGFDFALMATNTTGAATSTAVTSRHNVDAVGTVWGSGAAGNNYGGSLTLECTSCHDPHGKAGYTNAAAPAFTPTAGLANACDPALIGTNPCTLKTASYRLLRWQPEGSAGYTAPATSVNWSGGSLPTNGTDTGWTVPDNYAVNGQEWYTIGTTGAFAANDYLPGASTNNTYTTGTKNYIPSAVGVAFFCSQCHDRYLNNTKLRNNGSAGATGNNANGNSDASAYCGRPSTWHLKAASTQPNLVALDAIYGGFVNPVDPANPVHPVHPGECVPVYGTDTAATEAAWFGQFIGWADARSSGDSVFMYRHTSGEVRGTADGVWAASATAFTSAGRTCLSCHVAHGTSARADANPTVGAGGDGINPGTQATPLTDANNNGGTLAGGSTLLRMDGRTVCMRCHASTVNSTFP